MEITIPSWVGWTFVYLYGLFMLLYLTVMLFLISRPISNAIIKAIEWLDEDI